MSALEPLAPPAPDLHAFVNDIERLEGVIEAWEETPRAIATAHGRAIEALNGEALRRLVRALKANPAAMSAMRSAVTDEVVYAVLRRHDIVRASVNERVEAALEGVRPMLASHGGDVELVKVAPPRIEVRFLGACDGCPASALTFHAGVKKAVEDACPEITEILQVKGMGAGADSGVRFISPFAVGDQGDWVFAGSLSDIPQDGVLAIALNGEKLLLARQGVIVSCFQNACAHLGLPLDDGAVENGVITCPHHDFQYDLATGECLTAPEVQLQVYAVRVIGRRVEVRLAT